MSEIPPPPPPPNRSRRKTIFWFSALLLLIGILWFLWWFFYLRFHESTDDAYSNGNLIRINSAVPGSVIAFFADDTDLVKQGDLLVKLDPTPYQVTYENELASLAAVVLQVRQFYTQVPVSQANVENKQILLGRARYDFENRQALSGTLAISNEDYIHSSDDLRLAESNLKQAEYQLEVALDARGNTSPEQHPLIEEQKAKVRDAFYNLEHCSIFAPTTGFVAQRSVNVGEWVSPSINMMSVIPKDYVWVDANYKETQLTYMRVGQPVEVWFDMYGSHVRFDGKVLGIASGSGSVFSLIPPQNATGNWIKIVQRLPVRISLDPDTIKDFPVRLGISAQVNVNITDQSLPFLVEIPSREPVCTTPIFELDFTKVDQLMDEIIRKNLEREP